jgi:hypothetical protein
MYNSLFTFVFHAIFYASVSGQVVDNASKLPSLTYDYIIVGGEIGPFYAVIECP